MICPFGEWWERQAALLTRPRGDPRRVIREPDVVVANLAPLPDLRRRGHEVVDAGDWSLGRLSAVSRSPDGVLRAGANPRGMCLQDGQPRSIGVIQHTLRPREDLLAIGREGDRSTLLLSGR